MLISQSHGGTEAEHAVQLFDTTENLAEAVSHFLSDGFVHGDTMLVVSTRDHWDAIAPRLGARGVPVEQVLTSGQLTFRDARATLALVMSRGRPHRGLFDVAIGALVRQLKTRGARLRIYGEVVDVLAAEGDYSGASNLERLWNELGEREAFTLFCGYSAVHFGDPRSAHALRSICGCHSHVRSSVADPLGAFLIRTHVSCA